MTLRARREIGSLRAPSTFKVLRQAISDAHRPDFRIVHFSVQGDHLHMVLEASSTRSLSSGLRGLSIRAARAINRLLGRSGRVWADRYHRRDLETPREVRNALAYVFMNAQKHGRKVADMDPCSSAEWFDGWRDRAARFVNLAVDTPPVAAPRTYLLSAGWRRHGLISPGTRPC